MNVNGEGERGGGRGREGEGESGGEGGGREREGEREEHSYSWYNFRGVGVFAKMWQFHHCSPKLNLSFDSLCAWHALLLNFTAQSIVCTKER